ncbi:MAG TPA: DUF2203 domain-containing protein [Planctomycetota bacterium]|nr:DUF2203 domain-containing protein [Planctomycetota bacterium]
MKLYSVDEAERTLPLVKRIVRDIIRNAGEHENRLLQRKKLPLTPPAGSSAEEKAFKLEEEMETYEHEVLRCQRELERMGIELKDYRIGLLDFYSRYDGRIVYLCWKSDEGDTLTYWHDLQAGFRGRQRITPANRHRFQGMAPGEKYCEIA